LQASATRGITVLNNLFFSGAALTIPSISAPLKNHQMPPVHFISPETMAKRFNRANPADIAESSKPSAQWATRIAGERRELISPHAICSMNRNPTLFSGHKLKTLTA